MQTRILTGWAVVSSACAVLACVSGGPPASDAGWQEQEPGETPDLEPAELVLDDTASPPDDTGAAEPACDLETPVLLSVRPDDPGSTASPVIARALGGGYPIRSWEFLNYYAVPAPAPSAGLAPDLDLVPGRDAGTWELQIAIAAPPVGERPDIDLVWSVDVSGSMSGEPLARAGDAMIAMAAELRRGDVVSLVTWDDTASLVLDGWSVSGPMDPVVLGAIASLEAGASTDFSLGLRAAYDAMDRQSSPERPNRVVLISDAGANVGETDTVVIGAHAGRLEDATRLVGVAVGPWPNDTFFDTVTDLGNGPYLYVDSQAEAQARLGERFWSVLGVAAEGVEVDLELPPGFAIRRYSGDSPTHNPKAMQPQGMGPGTVATLYQILETCDAEPIPDDAAIVVRVRWTDPDTAAEDEVSVATTFGSLLAESPVLLHKGAAVYTYAESLRGGSREEALARLAIAEASWPGDPDLAEIRAILDGR